MGRIGGGLLIKALVAVLVGCSRAEPVSQLDPQSLAVRSVGVLIGSPPFIAGKLP